MHASSCWCCLSLLTQIERDSPTSSITFSFKSVRISEQKELGDGSARWKMDSTFLRRNKYKVTSRAKKYAHKTNYFLLLLLLGTLPYPTTSTAINIR